MLAEVTAIRRELRQPIPNDLLAVVANPPFAPSQPSVDAAQTYAAMVYSTFADMYLREVSDAATKALSGEDVDAEIAAIIDKARKHLAGIGTGKPLIGLRRLAMGLRVVANGTPSSQQPRREALEYAHMMVSEAIARESGKD